MELDLFLGRFHSLIVHLPIGALIFSVVLDVLSLKNDSFKSAARIGYYLTSATALVAVVSGFLLSGSMAYFVDDLDAHRWSALLFTLSVGIFSFLRYKQTKLTKKVTFAVLAFLLVMVSVTGHLGGNLTHGSDYLFRYAPSAVRSILSADQDPDLEELYIDSVNVYSHLVRPILQKECVGCHNADNALGGLDLTAYSKLFQSAYSEVPVQRGNALGSELFKRIIMDKEQHDFMPKGRAPLSFAQIEIIRYWIDQGADSVSRFSSDKISAELAYLLKEQFGLDVSPRPYFELVSVDSLSQFLLDSVNRDQWKVSTLGEDNFFLELRFLGDTLESTNLLHLDTISSNLYRMYLSGVYISDSIISKMPVGPHLSHIDLSMASFGDSLFSYLGKLTRLSVVNLHSTPSTTLSGLEKWLSAASLEGRNLKVYCWNTGLTEQDISGLRTRFPQVELVGQFMFIPPDTTKLKTFKIE